MVSAASVVTRVYVKHGLGSEKLFLIPSPEGPPRHQMRSHSKNTIYSNLFHVFFRSFFNIGFDRYQQGNKMQDCVDSLFKSSET